MNPNNNQFKSLNDFLSRLRSAKIHHALTSIREEAVMVQIAIPGERWEVEFFVDGHIEVERFKSDGTLANASTIEELFRDFSD